MSAIAAIYQPSGLPVDPDLISRMTLAAKHRGKDRQRSIARATIGMGHCAFWSTEESKREHQPEEDVETGIMLTFDGRLDNRDDLRQFLDSSGSLPDDDTDSLLVLALYRMRGESFLEYMVGDFALALWDPCIDALICARDFMGMRPLCYSWDNQRLRFACASEIGQLLTIPTMALSLDETYIYHHLTAYPASETQHTLYTNIRRVEKGQCLIVNRDGVRQSLYWDISRLPDIRYSREEDYVEHFRELLRKSIRARMRTHLKVGSILSGGYDSSSVTAIACDIFQRDGIGIPSLTAHAYLYKGPEFLDEPVHIRIQQILKQVDIPFHAVWGDDCWWFKDYPPADTLCYDADLIPFYGLWKRFHEYVAEAGVGVLLTGEWGNEVLDCNNHFLSYLLRSSGIREMLREYRNLQRLYNDVSWPELLRLGVQGRLPWKLRKAASIIKSLSPHRTAMPNRCFWMKRDCPGRDQSNSNAYLAMAERTERPWTRVDLMRIASLSYYISVDSFQALPLGIESRHPFGDRRIVEFMLSIPPTLKFSNGLDKSLLRRSMDGWLPDEILSSPNTCGTMTPLIRLGYEKERARIESLLRNAFTIDNGWVDSSALNIALESCQTSGRHGLAVGALLQLEFLLRQLGFRQ